jgi:Arylsulfotransferase (ASST)
MSVVAWIAFLVACSDGTTSDGPGTVTDGTDSGTPTDTETTPPTTPTIGAGDISKLAWIPHTTVGSLVYATWTQSAPADLHLEYSFDDGVWMSTPSRRFEAGDNQQVIVGIPYGYTADWRMIIEASGEMIDGEEITTAPWPAALPRPTLTVNDASRQIAGGNYLLTSMNQYDGGWTGGAYWTIILDRQGRLIWTNRTPGKAWTLFAQVAVTKDRILWDEQTYWSNFIDEGLSSAVHETYLDEEIAVIPTPGLHHAFIQLPDQTLVWGSQCHGGGEALVELHPSDPLPPPPLDDCPNSGVGSVIWTCTADWNAGSSCESNGLFYEESTDSFLYSFYTNSSIVEVDHITGQSLWWAGEENGSYAFIPSNAQFSWQHGISYTDAGTLLVSSEFGSPTETWLLEYNVDRAAETLELVWSDNSDSRAFTNGHAWRLSNGNTLHVVGSAAVVREVTADGEDVWRVEYDDDYLLGAGEFIEDLYTLVKPVEKSSGSKLP